MDELAKTGHHIYIEPTESPLERIRWSFYRPDVLGVVANEKQSRVVIVECETNPIARRIKEKTMKIRRWLLYQKRLIGSDSLSLLLVIPPGKLCRINKDAIRRLWEIWIINFEGRITYKVPRTAE